MQLIINNFKPWKILRAHCKSLADIHDTLKKNKYDVVIVDLAYNECALALAYNLGVPVVGFWAMSPSSGTVESDLCAFQPNLDFTNFAYPLVPDLVTRTTFGSATL